MFESKRLAIACEDLAAVDLDIAVRAGFMLPEFRQIPINWQCMDKVFLSPEHQVKHRRGVMLQLFHLREAANGFPLFCGQEARSASFPTRTHPRDD